MKKINLYLNERKGLSTLIKTGVVLDLKNGSLKSCISKTTSGA